MDARCLLILPAASLALGGCAVLARLQPGAEPAAGASDSAAPAAAARQVAPAPEVAAAAPAIQVFAAMDPIPNPRGRDTAPPARRSSNALGEPRLSGRAAIAAANAAARETSRSRAFLGGVQVFAYDPGRVYEVWTAPLRVTTLTLAPGESVISKAAGDTVRWQIGETQSGEAPNQRAHVMIKPLQRGLETNLVLATNRRVYLLQLRSGTPDAFNAAVTWDVASLLEADPSAAATAPAAPPSLVAPQGPLDAGFKITPQGRRPAWTPSAVMTDGVRTFLTFPPQLTAGEAPALFVLGPAGQAQLVNYRQQGALWVVDRVLDAAELRLGGRRPQVVRIQRTGAPS